MEIAKRDTKVELTDGRTVDLATMTSDLLPLVKLDGKEGKSIMLKRALVSDDDTQWVERRLFKYADNEKRVMYDLPLPKTNDKAIALFGNDVVEYVVKSVRVESDHAQMIGEGKKKLSPEEKALVDTMKAVPDEKKKEVNDAIAAILAQYGMKVTPQTSAAIVNDTKKGLKKSGFGK